jgi:hypothetical protein
MKTFSLRHSGGTKSISHRNLSTIVDALPKIGFYGNNRGTFVGRAWVQDSSVSLGGPSVISFSKDGSVFDLSAKIPGF